MKRVKLMLTAIAVFAVVGGALAVKAGTFGTEEYCTKVNSGNDVCTSFVTATFDGISGGTQLKYSKTTNTANCTNGNITCASVGRLRI